MGDFLFYCFAFITVLGAGSVVLTRNPVHAAMLLILSFMGTASLFVMLGSYFLAAVQLAVYAGAVIVLFPLIIMLLNVDATRKLRRSYFVWATASIIGLLMILGLLQVYKRGENFNMATLGDIEKVGATTKSFGVELFTTYMLPFQVAGVLLLIAMLGVIYISNRNVPKEEDAS